MSETLNGTDQVIVTRQADEHKHAIDLLGQCLRTLEHGQPPKGGFTSDLVKRVKRFLKMKSVQQEGKGL